MCTYVLYVLLVAGQTESPVLDISTHDPNIYPSSLSHDNGTNHDEEGRLLVMSVLVTTLSVICICVLVIVVIVMIVRIQRGCQWRRDRTNNNQPTAEKKYSGSGVKVHLLSTTISTQQIECYRPRSLTPASPTLTNSPSTHSTPAHNSSPSPPTVALTTAPAHQPHISPTLSTAQSASSHDYCEIETYPPRPAVQPSPSLKIHLYDEVHDECMENGDVTGNYVNEQVHQYSLLEDPSQNTNHNEDDQDSWGSLSLSQDSCLSIQDDCPNWIFSPVIRSEIQTNKPHPLPRRVIPYRVSLILPQWEGRGGPHLTPLHKGDNNIFSNSCNALDDTGRYNHLQSMTGYGSLEGREVYSILEPFIMSSRNEPSMRPRSRSCDARLYNHLQH